MEINYKHKWRPITKSGGHSNVHTQFLNPFSDDDCWEPPWNPVAIQVCPDFHLGGDSISE